MDTKDKQAIMLYEQGYSTDQIAQVLDMDPSYVDAIVQGQEKEIRYSTVEDESHKAGPKTKLTRERFEEMKRLLAQGLSVKVTAERMGFSWRYLQKVKAFATYDDLMKYREKDAAKKRGANSTSKQRNRMTEDLWNKAMQLKKKGITYEDIAAELGFSLNFVYKATHVKTYEDFLELRKREAAYKREKTQSKQPGPAMLKPEKETETLNIPLDQKTIEYRSMADSLARIAEALEKIAEQPKKRRFFKR